MILNTMKSQSIQKLCTVAAIAVSGFAYAAVPPPEVFEFFEPHSSAFINAPGYTETDVETVDGSDYYTPERFPNQGSAISNPDSRLDAITRGILLFEGQEGVLPRVRYRVTYNLASPPMHPEFVQEYVEVTRFNMGPTIRKDLAQYHEGQHLAPASEFGVGPHVSWRFVMAPMMGMRAGLFESSRRELSDAQAKVMDCLGESCLSMEDPAGPEGKWLTPPDFDTAAPTYTAVLNFNSVPARVAEELMARIASEEEGLQAMVYDPATPRVTVVISKDVVGQDGVVNGMLFDSNVPDDAIASIWLQRIEAAGQEPEFSEYHVMRRGRH